MRLSPVLFVLFFISSLQAQNPMGPYIYRGVIIDSNCSYPGVWNNHGSIVEYQDQWYVFYHRSTHEIRNFLYCRTQEQLNLESK